MAFGIVPALFCKERVMVKKKKKTPLAKALRMTFSSKPIMTLCGIIFTMLSAEIIGGPLMNYMNIAYTLNNEKPRIEYRQDLPVLLEMTDEEFVSITESGKRREGAFGAIYSLLMKLSAMIAISSKHKKRVSRDLQHLSRDSVFQRPSILCSPSRFR
jgi:Na+/melibiose symporter-like transporter